MTKEKSAVYLFRLTETSISRTNSNFCSRTCWNNSRCKHRPKGFAQKAFLCSMSNLKCIFFFIHQFSTLQFCDDEAASLLLLRLHRIRRRCGTLQRFTFQWKCKYLYLIICDKLIGYLINYCNQFFRAPSRVLLWIFTKMLFLFQTCNIIYENTDVPPEAKPLVEEEETPKSSVKHGAAAAFMTFWMVFAYLILH